MPYQEGRISMNSEVGGSGGAGSKRIIVIKWCRNDLVDA
jgi:hypothetical protein